jgi:hypothetical protein
VNREALLEREDEAWLAFAAALDAFPADRRGVEGVVPGWSAHDVVWHCAYWAAYAGDMIEVIGRGQPVPDQREDDDAWEAEILATGRGMSWDEVVARAEQGHDRARAALSAIEDPPDEAVQWFTDDTFGHYDEHAAEIRAFSS